MHPCYFWEIGHANEGTFFSRLQAGLPPVNKPISRQLVLLSKHPLAMGSGARRAWSGVICSSFGGVARALGPLHVPDHPWVFPQVTETRTGPLGCSNYDNLDSVSSVLVQSPENKVQLQGRTRLVGTW